MRTRSKLKRETQRDILNHKFYGISPGCIIVLYSGGAITAAVLLMQRAAETAAGKRKKIYGVRRSALRLLLYIPTSPEIFSDTPANSNTCSAACVLCFGAQWKCDSYPPPPPLARIFSNWGNSENVFVGGRVFYAWLEFYRGWSVCHIASREHPAQCTRVYFRDIYIETENFNFNFRIE